MIEDSLLFWGGRFRIWRLMLVILSLFSKWCLAYLVLRFIGFAG